MQIHPSIIPINFNHKTIFLVEHEQDLLPSLKGQSAILLFNVDESRLKRLITELQSNELLGAILVGDVQKNIQLFKSTFSFIQAGGGVVENGKQELLCIFRRGKWDLPKGKMDEGEGIEACALREVIEETGAKSLRLNHLIGTTYHLYFLHEMVFKQTDWFSMYTDSSALSPQAEEGIDEAIWVKKEDLHNIMQYTFDSIKWVLQKGNWLKN